MLSQPFFIPASLILVLSLPLILGLIPRNRFYGVRTSKTLSNDSIWYRANKFGGWALLVSSAIYLAVAAIVPDQPSPGNNFMVWLLHVGAFAGPLVGSLLLIHSYVKSL
jgi:uncharacterized membrane protein